MAKMNLQGKGADDMKKVKEQKVKKKLSVVRRVSYIFLAFTVFEFSGVFALAGLKGLYVVTETKSNAFYPKSYVDVGLREPNGQDYSIDADNIVVNDGGEGKQVYVENAGCSKKSVILRAKIVAEIYDESKELYQGDLNSADYKVSVGNDATYDSKASGHWYYSEGYYYYTSILDVDTKTTDLFDRVEITDEGIDKIPEGCCVKFHVMIDCLDAAVYTNGDLNKYWNDVPTGLAW